VNLSAASWVERARQFLAQDLWSWELRPGSMASGLQRTLQLSVMIGEGFVRDQLLMRASALTYITSLSVIPVLAVALSILKAFGVTQNLAELAVENLAGVIPEAKQTLLELVEGARIGGLGTLGAAILVVTTVLALRHFESTLNDLWGVRSARSWSRRFPDYLAVMIVGPLFLGVAISMGTTLQSGPVVDYLMKIPLFDQLWNVGLQQLPRVLLFLGFSFLYWFFPNTTVRVASALLGGLVAAVLFSIAQWGYVHFSVGAARYNALFGTFAAIPLLLVWIYVCWAMVLLGAEVSYAHQNLARYRREVRGGTPQPAEREAIGLRVAVMIARSFRDRRPAPRASDLADALDVPIKTIRGVLDQLVPAGIVAPRAVDEERDDAFQLGRPAADVSVSDVLLALRGAREPLPPGQVDRSAQAVSRVLAELDAEVAAIANVRSLEDVVSALPRDAEPPPDAIDRPGTGG